MILHGICLLSGVDFLLVIFAKVPNKKTPKCRKIFSHFTEKNANVDWFIMDEE
jgi:hypothetical protein